MEKPVLLAAISFCVPIAEKNAQEYRQRVELQLGLYQSPIPGALNGSEVPGNFHYGFSVMTGSGIGRGIAVPHVVGF